MCNRCQRGRALCNDMVNNSLRHWEGSLGPLVTESLPTMHRVCGASGFWSAGEGRCRTGGRSGGPRPQVLPVPRGQQRALDVQVTIGVDAARGRSSGREPRRRAALPCYADLAGEPQSAVNREAHPEHGCRRVAYREEPTGRGHKGTMAGWESGWSEQDYRQRPGRDIRGSCAPVRRGRGTTGRLRLSLTCRVADDLHWNSLSPLGAVRCLRDVLVGGTCRVS